MENDAEGGVIKKLKISEEEAPTPTVSLKNGDKSQYQGDRESMKIHNSKLGRSIFYDKYAIIVVTKLK